MDWVAIGLCADVPAGTIVARRVIGIDLALWCSAEGTYHVWGDRCPHRGMRLSHGFVRGQTLACIYHGWQYDQNGACDYIPAHPNLTPPKSICAKSYVCETRDAVVWVALEQTQSQIPDASGRRPVRSMDVARPASVVAAYLGQQLEALIFLPGPHDLALALQPSTPDSCMIHAFASPDADRKTVSRHLEQMRAEMETAT